MFTVDEKNLEKFIDIHISIPSLDGEQWEGYFTNTINIVLGKSKQYFSENELKYLNESFVELSLYLRPVLPSPRLIKSFCRHLLERIKSPAKSVNIIDLFALTAILATNPKLYRWIAEHRSLLVTTDYFFGQVWVPYEIDASDRDKDPAQREKEKVEYIYDQLSNTNYCSEAEKRLIKLIFFRDYEKYKFKFYYVSNVEEGRVTENHYFCNFFYRNDLPDIATESGKLRFIDAIKNEDLNSEDLYSFMRSEYEKYTRNDLKKLITDIIENLISQEEIEVDFRYKLLVAYGIFARNVLTDEMNVIISSKRRSAFSIWNFIGTVDTDEECEKYLLSLLNEPLSDEFLASIVFYSIHKERNPADKQFTDETLNKIKNKFNELCVNRFYKDADIINIFSSEVSDYPMQMLYRWSESNDENLTEKYLEKLFNTFPETINNFLPNFKRHPDQIKYLISINKMINVLDEIEKDGILNTDLIEVAQSIRQLGDKNGADSKPI